MEKEEGDRKKNISEDFDIKSELSTLVENKVISPKVADKLEEKLKEKKVKITKDQLNVLVEKIKDAIKNYSKFEEHFIKEEKTPIPTEEITDDNMLKLTETLEKLEERIAKIEAGQTGKGKQGITRDKKTPTMVTQDEIKLLDGEEPSVREWNIDPLLEIPGDPESIIILMKWLQYLIDKCGRSNLSAILDYYVDVGWISQDAKITLIDYSQGITEKVNIAENKKIITDLPSKDHIQSFLFIQKLKGLRFDKHFIERIDNEISRLTKKLDNYHFK